VAIDVEGIRTTKNNLLVVGVKSKLYPGTKNAKKTTTHVKRAGRKGAKNTIPRKKQKTP